jgi:CBS domain-containing protein
MKTVDLDTSLMVVSKMFSSEIHRVGVIHNDRLVNILSQSDIIRFLATRGVYIGSQMEKPISEEGLEPLGVASVLVKDQYEKYQLTLFKDNLPTIDVIRFMRDKMLSGVAVVDNQGRLVANFSGSDLLVGYFNLIRKN